MKAYTSLEQSKKLAEILPLESADMHYSTWTILDGEFIVSPNQGDTIEDLREDYGSQIIPCWSLAALLEIIPEVLAEKRLPDAWDCVSYAECQMTSANNFENLIDACVEVILKLHELKML